MTQYINKANVVAEIERIKKEECPIDTYEGRTKLFYFERFLSFINTLEVKEVELKKEIDNIWNTRFNLGWDEKSLLSMNHEGFTTIAKHFFELGLKQKGE